MLGTELPSLPIHLPLVPKELLYKVTLPRSCCNWVPWERQTLFGEWASPIVAVSLVVPEGYILNKMLQPTSLSRNPPWRHHLLHNCRTWPRSSSSPSSSPAGAVCSSLLLSQDSVVPSPLTHTLGVSSSFWSRVSCSTG